MNLDLPQELLVQGIAQGVVQFLTAHGAGEEFRELIAHMRGVHLLRSCLLTADQAAAMLQISRRTFDRQVSEGKWRKNTALGPNEPRFWLSDIVEKLNAAHVPSQGDPLPGGLLNLSDYTAAPKRRQKKAA